MVVPNNTAYFEQIVQASVVNGYTCPGSMTIALTVYVDDITANINPATFSLPTSWIYVTGNYYGVTSASVTPQTLTLVAFITNTVAETSVDLTY
jgi:hypothetical protein